MTATMTRRKALQVLATGGIASVAGPGICAEASEAAAGPSKPLGMLYDATICTGCQACVSACSEANDLPRDTRLSDGMYQMPIDLNSRTKNIIKLWHPPHDPDNFSFVKLQCMHCLDPACASGCPFHALHKDPVTGIVKWEGSLCIGCRYCEISCPFEVPKFEWDKFNPKIVKCELCYFRVDDGGQPGCTAACPTGAVIFGPREELLAKAHKRLADKPGYYFEDRVYGEFDAGGTQVLYLSRVPFSKIGLPSLGTGSAAEYATKVHRVLYSWLLIPLALYAVMAAFIRRNWRRHEVEAAKLEARTGLQDQL